jgi:hypothetical protein
VLLRLNSQSGLAGSRWLNCGSTDRVVAGDLTGEGWVDLLTIGYDEVRACDN